MQNASIETHRTDLEEAKCNLFRCAASSVTAKGKKKKKAVSFRETKMTNELTQLSSKQRRSLAPDNRLCRNSNRVIVTCKATCYQRESRSKKVPALGPGMGLFAFASTAFTGTPTQAQNSIKGEWERSAWQPCQGVNVLKRSEKLSGFQGPWHRPGKVTRKGRVS